MRVVQVAPSFYPSKGGVETHVWQVSKELIQLGHQVSVLTLDSASLNLKLLQLKLLKNQELKLAQITPVLPKLPVQTQLRSLAYKLFLWRQVIKLVSTLRSYDVIQVHDVAWWLLPIWPFFKKKIFITFHGWEGVYPVPKKNIYQRRFFSRLARGVIHVGTFIQKFYGDRPDLVIYGGTSVDNLKFRIKNLRFKIENVVFVGRLEKENELKKHLEFVKLLKNKYPNLNVIWVGDGRYRQRCQSLGQVTGMVGESTLADYLKPADLVLASSYLSILKALVYGKLVVAFYGHRLKESYLKDSPMAKYMLVSDSPKQVISWLAKESALPDLDQTREWAKKQTWGKVAKEYLRLWYGGREGGR